MPEGSILANLEGLMGLSTRDGVDVRPALLRVLTDLYIQQPDHTADEERHFTELALRLIDGVDVPTRASVSIKLSTYPATPKPIVHQLARDVIDVAEPMLMHSSNLSSHDLLKIIGECGPRHAAAIAARNGASTLRPARSTPDRAAPAASPPTDAASATERHAAVAATLPPATLAVASQAERPGQSAAGRLAALVAPPVATSRLAAAAIAVQTREPIAAPPDGRTAELGEAFMRAGTSERRRMLDELSSTAEDMPPTADHSEAVNKIETAALARRGEDVRRILAESLGLPAETARRIVDDELGELVVVAAKALGMPQAVLLRVLLFVNPVIGRSVERVFGLTKVYDRLAAAAAQKIVSSWKAAMPVTAPVRPSYQPLLYDDAGSPRGSADAARRASNWLREPASPRREPSLPARGGQRTT